MSVLVLKQRYVTRSELPGLVNIENIILINDVPYAISTKFDTVNFVQHFHAYHVKVSYPNKKILVNLKLLNNCEPLWLLRTAQCDSNTYVFPRHWV